MSARILLVEDEVLVALSISETLRDSGFQVESVDSGNALLTDAVRGPWDAALVDMGLPDCSGIDVVRHLRAQQPDIPIILTTGLETPETIAFAAECKLSLLPKPFYEHQLLPLIQGVLSDSSDRRVLPDQEISSREPRSFATAAPRLRLIARMFEQRGVNELGPLVVLKNGFKA